ncbi:4Fe-4S single cluster domain-containing protein [Methanoregula sp.]|uniref:4Fe-4S single cluster domain-containing protein n=1 Tax=Methanoregula sp. TaxID=2052170 RepID=UPI003D10BC82
MVHVTSDPGCRPKSVLNLAGFLARSEVNGPGIRAVVWVQGCPIRCRGCFNPQSWSFSPAHMVAVDELSEQILALDDIDGVTFSGGEPFAQAAALADLGGQMKHAGLSIVTFTGYTHEHILRDGRPSYLRLLMMTDLLIAGPYIPSCAPAHPFAGSGNQCILPLNGNLASGTAVPVTPIRQAEYTILPDGSITVTGFPGPQVTRRVAARCRRGVRPCRITAA